MIVGNGPQYFLAVVGILPGCLLVRQLKVRLDFLYGLGDSSLVVIGRCMHAGGCGFVGRPKELLADEVDKVRKAVTDAHYAGDGIVVYLDIERLRRCLNDFIACLACEPIKLDRVEVTAGRFVATQELLNAIPDAAEPQSKGNPPTSNFLH